MSKLPNDELDEILRAKMLGHEKKPSPEVWSMLAKDLPRQNFLTFGWKHFNIFQVVASILVLLLIVFYFTRTTDAKSSDDKKTSPVTSDKKILASDSILQNQDTRNITNESAKSSKRSSQHKTLKNVNLQTSDTISSEKMNRDSVLTLPSTDPVGLDKPEVKKREEKIRKILTVDKTDTIIEKDTVAVRRKRKSK